MLINSRTNDARTIGAKTALISPAFWVLSCITLHMSPTFGHGTSTRSPLPIRIARRLAGLWCTLMHDSLMWPIHGEWQCRTCGRRQAVAWAQLSRTRDAQRESRGKFVSI
jgi:hypothetical protein